MITNETILLERLHRAFNHLIAMTPTALMRHWTPFRDEEAYHTEHGVKATGGVMFVNGRFGVYHFDNVSRAVSRSLLGKKYVYRHHDTFRVIEYDEDGDQIDCEEVETEEHAVCLIEYKMITEALQNRIADTLYAQELGYD